MTKCSTAVVLKTVVHTLVGYFNIGSEESGFMESLTRSTAEVVRDLWRLLSPTHLLKGGSIRHTCKGLCALLDFEHLQGWRIHKFSGQPVPVFDHLHSKKKSFFFFLNGISCVSMLLILSLSYTEKSLAPSFSLLPI